MQNILTYNYKFWKELQIMFSYKTWILRRFFPNFNLREMNDDVLFILDIQFLQNKTKNNYFISSIFSRMVQTWNFYSHPQLFYLLLLIPCQPDNRKTERNWIANSALFLLRGWKLKMKFFFLIRMLLFLKFTWRRNTIIFLVISNDSRKILLLFFVSWRWKFWRIYIWFSFCCVWLMNTIFASTFFYVNPLLFIVISVCFSLFWFGFFKYLLEYEIKIFML